MEMDYELLRRYAGMQQGKIRLEQAKTMGFVQDANDELLYEEAGKNIEQYLAGQPDNEIANPVIDIAVLDDILSRIKAM
jgi:hypothetical protein